MRRGRSAGHTVSFIGGGVAMSLLLVGCTAPAPTATATPDPTAEVPTVVLPDLPEPMWMVGCDEILGLANEAGFAAPEFIPVDRPFSAHGGADRLLTEQVGGIECFGVSDDAEDSVWGPSAHVQLVIVPDAEDDFIETTEALRGQDFSDWERQSVEGDEAIALCYGGSPLGGGDTAPIDCEWHVLHGSTWLAVSASNLRASEIVPPDRWENADTSQNRPSPAASGRLASFIVSVLGEIDDAEMGRIYTSRSQTTLPDDFCGRILGPSGRDLTSEPNTAGSAQYYGVWAAVRGLPDRLGGADCGRFSHSGVSTHVTVVPGARWVLGVGDRSEPESQTGALDGLGDDVIVTVSNEYGHARMLSYFFGEDYVQIDVSADEAFDHITMLDELGTEINTYLAG